MIAGREIALANLTVLDAAPPAIVDAAAAAGFDSVTLRLADRGGAEDNPLVGDTPVRRATIARLEHHGLSLLEMEVVRMRADAAAAALRPVFESAAALGARFVLVVGLDPDALRAAERFAEVCAEADAFGLRPVLEFMVFTAVRTVADADAIVARAAHPAGGVLVDALHLCRSGGSPTGVAPLAGANPRRYPYLQLCDAPLAAPAGGLRAIHKEAVENRLAPGDGELPLRELLDAMPAGVPLSIETPVATIAHLPPVERARHAMAATRRLLER